MLILSNSCYYIGTKINIFSYSSVKTRREIVLILLTLQKYDAKAVGRQLANSACTAVLLDLFFDEQIVNSRETNSLNFLWKKLILRLTHQSTDIREAFGKNGINRVLNEESISSLHIEFLCYFTQVYNFYWKPKNLSIFEYSSLILDGFERLN